MGHELWAELSAAISLTDLHFFDNSDFEHPTNWDRACRPVAMPSQSTLCRRLRSPEFDEFMGRLADRLRHLPHMAKLFKRMDAKTLTVAAHSTDPDAGWGRGAGQMSNGYKIHSIWAGGAMPLLWRVAPLNVSEQEMARRMLRDLTGHGLVVADSSYDINLLYETAASSGHRLTAPRKRPGTGPGHRVHHPDRSRSIASLEGPTAPTTTGPGLIRDRGQIERDFANLCSFGGGMSGGLPSWVRRHRRVNRWVRAKLLINAARIRINERRKSRDDE